MYQFNSLVPYLVYFTKKTLVNRPIIVLDVAGHGKKGGNNGD